MRGGWGALCALAWAFAHLPTAVSESCSLADLSCYACKYLGIGSDCEGYTYSYVTEATPKDPEELICLSHWPSETGNYYGPTFGDHVNQLDARDDLGNAASINGDGHTTWISQVSDDHGLESPVRLLPREDEQCCRVTWECWYFWGTLGEVAYGVNLTKSDCCIRDFLRPKSECPNPPNLEIAVLMSFKEPPACSRVEDS